MCRRLRGKGRVGQAYHYAMQLVVCATGIYIIVGHVQEAEGERQGEATQDKVEAEDPDYKPDE